MNEDQASTPASEIPLDAPARTRIAPDFTIAELTHSETALRLGIDNGFEHREQFEAAIHLCRNVMQPVRDHFGSVAPNSVYRSQTLERALKAKHEDWRSMSQHTRGEACDIEVPDQSALDLAHWICQHLAFDQLICECYDPQKGPDTGWVHVSLKPPGGVNRRELLSYLRNPETKKYVYLPGLVESIG